LLLPDGHSGLSNIGEDIRAMCEERKPLAGRCHQAR